MGTVFKISKLDAAKRQLETAIGLYVNEDDPVSIHTLTAAAYNVLRDINEKRGGTPLLSKEQFLKYVRPEHHKELKKKINQAENFFKHADRDHNSILEFNPGQSEMLLYEACLAYEDLSGEERPLFNLFRLWFMLINSHLFNLSEYSAKVISDVKPDLAQISKQEFFEKWLPQIVVSNP